MTSFSIEATRLRRMVKALDLVVERRNTIPILGTVLIRAKDNAIIATVTDLEQDMIITDEAVTEGKSEFCINLDTLKRFASFATGAVAFTMVETPKSFSEHAVEITDSDTSLRVNTLWPVVDFPVNTWTKPQAVSAQRWKMSHDQAKRLFGNLLHCISTEETRYYLNGVFLTAKPEANTLRAVATDGHRLGVVDTDIPVDSDFGAIVPRKSVNLIMAMFTKGGNEPISVTVSDLHYQIKVSDVLLAGKLIDGRFPDYTRVIPSGEPKMSAHVSAESVKRLNAMLTGGRFARSAVAFDYDTQRLNGQSADSEYEFSVPFQGTSEVKGHQGFNFRFLYEQSRVTPAFTMKAAGVNDPAIVQGEDPDAMWVMMPMRV
ncbi:hypothetical protein [uncultured Roseobacter sp.]|uniref:DNA polymerase III subunit beta n=1 Tax=uncultured Roseobacter sp. TaxID=114847 RepID=UPI0026205AEC|nr:hypothetical protein [uncultured Roseobacter sp.]